jgi:hypothetical protein
MRYKISVIRLKKRLRSVLIEVFQNIASAPAALEMKRSEVRKATSLRLSSMVRNIYSKNALQIEIVRLRALYPSGLKPEIRWTGIHAKLLANLIWALYPKAMARGPLTTLAKYLKSSSEKKSFK